MLALPRCGLRGYGAAVSGAAEAWIAGYGGTPTSGVSPVWIAGYGGAPAAAGASPIWIGGYITAASGGSGHSPQADAYLARTVGGNEGGNGANIATLIDGLVADGVWANLDALYVLAQQNETDAKLNLVSASYPLAQVGAIRVDRPTPTIGQVSFFTTYVGFSALMSPAVYFNTGFNATTATSPHFSVQNSATLWAMGFLRWLRTAAEPNGNQPTAGIV